MSNELLKRLCCAQLPTKIEMALDIDQLVILKNAGLIEADIPQKQQEIGCEHYVGQAIVMRVTARGQQVCLAATTEI